MAHSLTETLQALKDKVGGGVDPGVYTLLEQIVEELQGITIDAALIDATELPTSDPQDGTSLWLNSKVVTLSTAA